MGIHNICLYKEVDETYTGCNLKTTKLLDCALIWVCAVIRAYGNLCFFVIVCLHNILLVLIRITSVRISSSESSLS